MNGGRYDRVRIISLFGFGGQLKECVLQNANDYTNNNSAPGIIVNGAFLFYNL